MKILIVILAMGSFFLSIFTTVPAQSASIGLTFKGDALSANLKGVCLEEILEKLEREKGISWKGNSSLLEEEVTVQFKNLSLDEGVKRILRSMNHYLIFDAGERLAGIIIIGEKTGGQVMPKGRILAQKKQTHERQAAKADESEAYGGPVAITKTNQKSFKVMRNVTAPGGSSEPAAEEIGNFKVAKNLPAPGGSTQVSQEDLDSFKVIKNISPPGGSTQLSKEDLDSFKVRKNLPPPGS